MARAVLAGVGKRYGASTILDAFSLTVADGELVTVLGPSGCGKSTLLRLIAGLEDLSAGTIHLGERRIDTLPPQQRDVAMVFQSYALYPHLTVRANVEFPLRMQGVPRAERRQRAEQVATTVEIAELLERRPGELSGGQRQRVALARALVRSPALFLLDEPLSNLDTRLRASVRQAIRDLQRRLAVTTLYVTHDQTEAMTLGDRVVVLERGRIQQCDAPRAVYERPANTFVAGFVGTPPMNLVPATCRDGRLSLGARTLELDPSLRRVLASCDGPMLVGVRAESFVACAGEPDPEALVADVERDACEYLGGEVLLRGRVAGSTVQARLIGDRSELPARIAAPRAALHLFAADDGRRLGP
jgi:multiple sugar transport system ATP-binding protein